MFTLCKHVNVRMIKFIYNNILLTLRYSHQLFGQVYSHRSGRPILVYVIFYCRELRQGKENVQLNKAQHLISPQNYENSFKHLNTYVSSNLFFNNSSPSLNFSLLFQNSPFYDIVIIKIRLFYKVIDQIKLNQ